MKRFASTLRIEMRTGMMIGSALLSLAGRAEGGSYQPVPMAVDAASEIFGNYGRELLEDHRVRFFSAPDRFDYMALPPYSRQLSRIDVNILQFKALDVLFTEMSALDPEAVERYLDRYRSVYGEEEIHSPAYWERQDVYGSPWNDLKSDDEWIKEILGAGGKVLWPKPGVSGGTATWTEAFDWAIGKTEAQSPFCRGYPELCSRGYATYDEFETFMCSHTQCREGEFDQKRFRSRSCSLSFADDAFLESEFVPIQRAFLKACTFGVTVDLWHFLGNRQGILHALKEWPIAYFYETIAFEADADMNDLLLMLQEAGHEIEWGRMLSATLLMPNQEGLEYQTFGEGKISFSPDSGSASIFLPYNYIGVRSLLDSPDSPSSVRHLPIDLVLKFDNGAGNLEMNGIGLNLCFSIRNRDLEKIKAFRCL